MQQKYSIVSNYVKNNDCIIFTIDRRQINAHSPHVSAKNVGLN